MPKHPRDEREELERQFDQAIENLIAVLPTDGRTQIIRKEAKRREAARIEVRAAKSKESELEKQREAFETETKRQAQRRFEERSEIVAELEKLLANVPEARILLLLIKLLSERQEQLSGRSADGLLLGKGIEENLREFQTHLDKKLEDLSIGSFSAVEQVDRTPSRHIDSLTGIYNFQYLNDVLTWETARADRYNYPLTMLLIDLDRFKHVNDTYGHMAGDKVLRSVAWLLRSSVREADVVFRSRVDEFIVLLPFTHLADAVQVRERILRRAGTSELLPGRPGEVTMTIVMGQYKVAEGKESFMARVDDALFQAKRDDDGLSGLFVRVR